MENAFAHVDYVGSNGDGPLILDYLTQHPKQLILIIVLGSLFSLLGVGVHVVCKRSKDISEAGRTLKSYKPYLPWMLRLSLGLPLIGAGFSGYIFTPIVTESARLIQVGIGFGLLFGLGTRLVALSGLLLYIQSLAVHGNPMLLANEYVVGFISIIVLGAGQPSADGLIRRLRVTKGTLVNDYLGSKPSVQDILGLNKVRNENIGTILRLGMGFNFLYLGLTQKLMDTGTALTVVSRYNLDVLFHLEPMLIVIGAGITEIAIGMLLILGIGTRGVATAGFIILTSTLFGLPKDPVLAHITLFGMTSALMVTGAGSHSLHERFDSSVIRIGRSVESVFLDS